MKHSILRREETVNAGKNWMRYIWGRLSSRWWSNIMYSCSNEYTYHGRKMGVAFIMEAPDWNGCRSTYLEKNGMSVVEYMVRIYNKWKYLKKF